MKDKNERVIVHDLRGFASETLEGAFRESEAVSRGTRCKQHLFSLILNPPPGAKVGAAAFEDAADRAEARLGLTGQPRALVFHDKRGADGAVRRHAHAVWCRIDADAMRARALPYHKRRLQDVARDLYHDHGWIMPPGLARKGARDPRNFTLAEWQQARRIKEDPREIKTAFQDAWAISDSKVAFSHALQERGYWLARGDKRGYVAVDRHGEVHNIAKRVGVKTKDVRERLGDMAALPSVADAGIEIARAMQTKMADFQREIAEREAREKAEAARKREAIRVRQQAERLAFQEAARQRQQAEEREREERLRKGLRGFWDFLRGERQKTLARNAREAEAARQRDKAEQERLKAVQLAQRRQVVQERARQRETNQAVTRDLTEDAKVFRQMESEADQERAARREAFKAKRRATAERPRRRTRTRDGPKPGR